VSLQIAIDLVISSICATDKCNAVGTLDIIPKNEKRIYFICLGGHTSNPTDESITKKRSTRNHLLDHDKENSGDLLEDESIGTIIKVYSARRDSMVH